MNFGYFFLVISSTEDCRVNFDPMVVGEWAAFVLVRFLSLTR